MPFHPRVPHPIPYQGSKRKLAPFILSFATRPVRRLIEPFAGSAAVTLAAVSRRLARHYVIGDSLPPLVELWTLILRSPIELADRYEILWRRQLKNPRKHYEEVREAFNNDHCPIKLLYLLARCVKNAVRFNPKGEFNQSADHRRNGMHPDKMRKEIQAAAKLLARCSTVQCADYRHLLEDASRDDLVYMDPPYQGVSQGRDPRYYEPLDLQEFLSELERLNRRRVRYLLSFDGRCGTRKYGAPLPPELNLKRVEIHAGPSSQATLVGREEETVESLYLSPELAGLHGSFPVRVWASSHLRQATLQLEQS